MFVKFAPSASNIVTVSSPHLNEKSEGRSMSYVPMVYEKSDPTPVRWEYKTLKVDTREQALPDASELNELGDQGWILINVVTVPTSSLVNFYFLRQVAE